MTAVSIVEPLPEGGGFFDGTSRSFFQFKFFNKNLYIFSYKLKLRCYRDTISNKPTKDILTKKIDYFQT